jgi:hypothetical protein
MCWYTPPLLKKVIDEYFGLNDLYPKVKLGYGGLSPNITVWVPMFLTKPKTFIELDFKKNGNQDSIKKIPIHIRCARVES